MAPATEQVWALRVNIATLGAHLTAYITSRPIINTLRLCNRFGSGDKGITTIPIELVEHVEQYIVDSKRGQERKVWAQDQKCCEARCKLVDHLGEDELHEMYHQMQAAGVFEWSNEDRLCVLRKCHRIDTTFDAGHSSRPCGQCVLLGPGQPHSEEHAANQHDKVEARLEQLEKEDSLSDTLLRRCSDVCHDSWAAWRNRTGEDHGENLGVLGELSKVLRKDFGLEIRVTHGRYRFEQYDTVGLRSNSAYLQLPVGDLVVEGQDITPTPTTAHLARFARAVKVLGLEVLSAETNNPKDDFEEEDTNENGEKIVNAEESINMEQPCLVTFSKYADNGDLVWASDYYNSSTMQDEMGHLGDDDWKWAVLKVEKPKTEEASNG